MLNGVKQNEKKATDLKKSFEKNILDHLTKSLTRHAEFYQFVEKISSQFEQYTEFQDKQAKEYEAFVFAFNQAMEKKVRKADKDIFHECHKHSTTICSIVGLLQVIFDDLVKLQPLAVSKENEYLKTFAYAFKQYSMFAQENFGSSMGSNMGKAKFVFDVVRLWSQARQTTNIQWMESTSSVML